MTDRACLAESTDYYLCTLDPGHDGPHQAHGSEPLVSWWTEPVADGLRDELVTLLTSPQHAPMNAHAPDSAGNPECVSCPWPLHMLSPEEIADVLIAAGWTKEQP